jgi:hypothetical protein
MVTIYFDIHRWETEYSFERLLDYMEMNEGQFNKNLEAERKRIPQKPIGTSEEDYADWQSEILFYEELYEKDFPSKIRYSFVVLLQITIETRLRAACNEIAKRRELMFKERKGSPIERASTFLKKVAQIDLEDWMAKQELNDFQKVRDCIVHTNGQVELSRDKDRLTELTKNNIGISINDEGFLVIDRNYCGRILDTAKKFFEELYIAAGFGPSTPFVA